MTRWGNELLNYCLENPFEQYEKYFEQDLFQFSSVELELKLFLDIFDQISYNDEIYLVSPNGIVIEGYVNGRQRVAVNPDPKQGNFSPYGLVRIMHPNIKAKTAINAQNINVDEVSYFYPPAQLIKNLSKWNYIFSHVDIQWGTFPLSGGKIIENAVFSYLGAQEPEMIIVPYYFDHPYERAKYWKLKIEISYPGANVTNTKTIYYLYQRKIGYLIAENTWRNSSNYPPFNSKSWKSEAEKEYNENAPFYRFNVEKHIQGNLTTLNGAVKSCYIWDKANNSALVLMAFNFVGYNVLLYLVKDYTRLCPNFLFYNLDSQPFANILCDLCFLFDSHFMVRNFDQLYIRGNHTGINIIDFKNYLPYVVSYDQKIEELVYNDYAWRSQNCSGENAFGFDDALADMLNNYYRANYVAQLVTTLKIFRVRGKRFIADLPEIELGDQLKCGFYDLGIVKKIGFRDDGDVYHLECRRLLSDFNFNDWWQI